MSKACSVTANDCSCCAKIISVLLSGSWIRIVYLPEQDCYIELTTLKQSLVTKKNRKLRCLRQLHPSINIKLFYARDFRSLMTKYGLKSALHACNLTSPPSDSSQDHAGAPAEPQPSAQPG